MSLKTRCGLCPHRCILAPGKTGLCKVRKAPEHSANTPPDTAADFGSVDDCYGHITALAVDPIEKKPLYHWRPSSRILSVGFSGCNLRCPFCQNWQISQTADVPGCTIAPHELIAAAKDCGQIAYTYSEPLVHAEYLADCFSAAREAGIANVLVTNGCVNASAAEMLLSNLDAVNVDLKCFSEKTYRDILGGDLSTVLDFIRRALAMGVHTEITTLVVPALNDGEKELTAASEWIAGLSQSPPVWHLSAYHPDWKWDAPPSAPQRLIDAARKARAILPYVYTGNINEDNDTYCACGAALVRRRGYSVDTGGLCLQEPSATNKEPAGKEMFYRCKACGKTTPLRQN